MIDWKRERVGRRRNCKTAAWPLRAGPQRVKGLIGHSGSAGDRGTADRREQNPHTEPPTHHSSRISAAMGARAARQAGYNPAANAAARERTSA